MEYKPWLSLVAIALTLTAFLPYILSIMRGRVRPHMFSWVIWGITTGVVFFALFTARNLIVVLALEHYSLTTVLFPAVMAIACIGLMAMVAYRRRTVVD